MSDKEEIEKMDDKYIFAKHQQNQKSSDNEQDDEDDDQPKVHFEVMECEGEEFRLVQKPSKPKISQINKIHANRNRRSSAIWNTFTIRDSLRCMASCNICGMRLSYKSTVSNLRNHLKRKHNDDASPKAFRGKFQERHHRTSFRHTPNQKKSLTELGGLDGLILNVVGEEGDPLNTEDEEVAEEAVIYTTEPDAHDHQTEEHTPRSTTAEKRRGYRPQSTSYSGDNREYNSKKSRVLDLQLECLEMKKYQMQMEALVLEQQLNLPRSVFTESLREVDVFTRGTQTDVGGDTKVFYVSDKAGDSQGAHLFQFRGRIFN